MKFEEIKTLLQYNDYKGYESKIFIPNEIFNDLKANIKNTPHIAFAYSYTYLVTWLYRYTKFLVNKDAISNSKVKEILGYKPETRTINYLIKKNGLLDQIGYLITENDFPVWWNKSQYEELEFTMYSKEKKLFIHNNVPRNYTVKYPVKAFYRTQESEDNNCEDGTFYEVDNTHCIPFEVFMYCMSNDDIGCTGFYLYSYLKHKNDIYTDGYDVSLEGLSSETGIKDRTLDKYLGMLKSYRLIDFIINQEFFAVGLKEEDRMANTYITNDFEMFSDEKKPYQTIDIMKKKDYLKKVREEEEAELEKIFGNTLVDIPLEELPF